MPTFEDAVADAAEAQQAIRGLAHAMQGMSDPSQGYPVLGSLTWGLASLEFALGQLARVYETTAREQAEVQGDRDAGRDSAQRVAEHLRAASESVARAVESVTYAHNADSEISYAPPTVPHTPRHGTRVARPKVTPGIASAPARTVEVDGPWL
jgi:hypothetical protein